MWNDTDVPLAYFITFRTYGTWLHGDSRGSVNRFRNQYGTPTLPRINSWVEINKAKLKSKPVKLDREQRKCVDSAIRECCRHRNWKLLALNVRSNHVHLVIANNFASSGQALGALKANATREFRESGFWDFEHSPWVDKGSRLRLWNNEHINAAIDYVLYGQGDDIPALLRGLD